jgi:hypothetical protein
MAGRVHRRRPWRSNTQDTCQLWQELSVQTLPPSQPLLPIAWTQVLDKVDETLRRTAEAAAQREQAIPDLFDGADAEADRVARWQEALKRLHEQMPGWFAVLSQAEKEAAEADTVLGAAEETLRAWLSEAEALGQRLAKWVKTEV